MKRTAFLSSRGLGLLVSLAVLPPAHAQTVTWSGPDTGPWHTGANWTPAGVPGLASEVVIDGETATARAVDLNSSATVNRVTISSGDTLRVNGNTSLQTSAAGYSIDGLLNLTGGGDSRLTISAADTLLTGSGQLRMTSPSRLHGNGSMKNSAVVTGAGNIGANELFVINEAAGRIAASTSGQTLALDPRSRGNDPGLTNAGRLEASGGGTLLLSGFGSGWFDNTGGTITAREGSEVQMAQDASVAYGTLATEGSGVIRINSSHNVYWTDLTNTGRAVISNNSYLRANGTFPNTGTLTLDAAGNVTRLQLHAPVTLTGTGKLVLGGSGTAQVGSQGDFVLTNTGGHTIEGLGNLGVNEAGVLNTANGVIRANVAGSTLALDPRFRGNDPGLTNQGQMEATGGGTLLLSGFGSGWFDNTGGAITARDGSEVQMAQDASVAYGTLATEGSGVIRINSSQNVYWTDLTNNGRAVVSNNSYLRANGTFPNTGTLTLDAAGNATRLQLHAPVTLTGTGKLVLGGSGTAQVGSQGDFMLTNTGGHTIEGLGNLGVNEAGVLNTANGVIRANVAGSMLALDPRSRGNDPGLTNQGQMEASGGGILLLSGFGSGWFDNTGGTITAREGSEVQMAQDASVAYGTLATEGSGVIRINGSHNVYWTDLTNTGRAVVGNNSYLRADGTLTNTGTLTLEATGNSTRLQLQAPVTLTGAGKLVLSGSDWAHVGAINDFTLTNTGGHVIEGRGNIGVNEAAVENRADGIIRANVSGGTLVLDPRSRDGAGQPGLRNRGTIEARDGGILWVSGYGSGWFDNAGGTIVAREGSEVRMGTSVSIVHGTLTSEETGFLTVVASDNTYWTDLTHAGRTFVQNNAYLRASGTLTNTGTVTLEAAGNSTRLQLQAPVTLTGAGKLVLGGSDWAHVGAINDFTLTNTGGHVIEGRGNIGVNEAAVENRAGSVIRANVSGQALTIDPRSRDADSLPGCLNRGTIEARDGGFIYLSGFGGGWFDNTGGVIRSRAGSEVRMGNSVSIVRGNLTSEDTGFFAVATSDNTYWTDLSHAGRTVIGNNAALRISGIIENTGTISTAAGANVTYLRLQANATLRGGGKVILASEPGRTDSNSRVAGNFLLTNDHHTIEGHGNIGANESAIFNTAGSLIAANVAERGLTLDPRSTGLFTNRGILRASNGGDLYLSGFGGGGFDNANGIVEALDGSRVYFVNSAAISGGVFRTSGSGAMVLPASQAMTFTANTANTGLFTVENNSTVYTGSRLTNSGVMRFNAAANLSSLVLQDNTTLAGGGVIELNGNNARIAGQAVLIVEDQTIRGTGNIGWNEASISVGTKGLVIADVPGGTLNFDATPLFGFTNEGTLRAEGGGILNLSSFGGGDIFVGATGRVEAIEGGRVQFDNNTNLINRSGSTLTGGTWLVKGRTAATSLQLPGGNITTNAANIELDGAQAQFAQLAGLTANNGTLTLSSGATLAPSGTFTNSGALEIGSASSLNAAGAVTLLPASSLTCHIGGPSSAGSLNSAGPGGHTDIAGRLTVVFDPGFAPAAGNSWTLISGPPSGTFAQVTVLGLPSSLRASLEYTPNFVNVNLSTRDGISFADWAATYAFASPADAAPGADPDADGIQNLLEFALGTHPLQFEADAAPVPVIVTVSGLPYPGLRYWKPAGASRRTGITYAPERSASAVTWTGSDIVLHSTVPADASGREQITVRHTATVNGKHLMRLRVSQP